MFSPVSWFLSGVYFYCALHFSEMLSGYTKVPPMYFPFAPMRELACKSCIVHFVWISPCTSTLKIHWHSWVASLKTLKSNYKWSYQSMGIYLQADFCLQSSIAIKLMKKKKSLQWCSYVVSLYWTKMLVICINDENSSPHDHDVYFCNSKQRLESNIFLVSV